MTLKSIWILLVILAIAQPRSSSADSENLLSGCKDFIAYVDDETQSYDRMAAGYCIGLVRGVMDMTAVLASIMEENGLGKAACVPVGVTDRHVIRVTVKYLEENPDKLHLQDSTLVSLAMMEAYACS